jgi:hypothetical protein
MTAKPMWRQGRVPKDCFADYRGLSARVRVDPETGKVTEISWYIGQGRDGFTRQSYRGCGKTNRNKVIDHQIASEAKWKVAETRYQRGLFLRR